MTFYLSSSILMRKSAANWRKNPQHCSICQRRKLMVMTRASNEGQHKSLLSPPLWNLREPSFFVKPSLQAVLMTNYKIHLLIIWLQWEPRLSRWRWEWRILLTEWAERWGCSWAGRCSPSSPRLPSSCILSSAESRVPRILRKLNCRSWMDGQTIDGR